MPFASIDALKRDARRVPQPERLGGQSLGLLGFLAVALGVSCIVVRSAYDVDHDRAAGFQQATTAEALGALNSCRIALTTEANGLTTMQVYMATMPDVARLDTAYDSPLTDRSVSGNTASPLQFSVVDAQGVRREVTVPAQAVATTRSEGTPGGGYASSVAVAVGSTDVRRVTAVTDPVTIYPEGPDGPSYQLFPEVSCLLTRPETAAQ